MHTIKDSNVLVTGANRGIGKTIVENFLEEGAAKIYAAARDIESLAPLVISHRDRVIPVHIDLNQPESITKAAELAKDVDVVVNNAGILTIASPLSDDAI